MQPNIPDTLAADAAFIAVRVAEFERRKGKIKTIPILVRDPKTADIWRAYASTRKADEPIADVVPAMISTTKRHNETKSNIARRERAAFAPKLRELVEGGMPTAEIIRQIGVTRRHVELTSKEHRIKLSTRQGAVPLVTDEQVRLIRKDYAAKTPYKVMAARYGCSESCIRDIVIGKTRADVI